MASGACPSRRVIGRLTGVVALVVVILGLPGVAWARSGVAAFPLDAPFSYDVLEVADPWSFETIEERLVDPWTGEYSSAHITDPELADPWSSASAQLPCSILPTVSPPGPVRPRQTGPDGSGWTSLEFTDPWVVQR